MHKKFIKIVIIVMMTCNVCLSQSTNRIPQFSNDLVNVWQTTIYPGKHQELKMHRHETNRVVIALDAGLLKIQNNQGQAHYITLEKNKAYYLAKNKANEWHTDENMTRHPIRVMVIELKK